MQNIYEKIDVMFSGENDDRPVWAIEILDELRELKELLKMQQNTKSISHDKPQHDFNKYNFINELRAKMKPNVENNLYPYFIFNGQQYGINIKGLLYNQSNTNKLISRQEAFEIFDKLYYSNVNISEIVCCEQNTFVS